MKKIIGSNSRRNDGINDAVAGLQSIVVHTSCRKRYTRDYIPCSSNENTKTTRSSLTQFQFKAHCLFCGENCDNEKERKKPVSKWDISEVRTTVIQDTILRVAAEYNDDVGNKVKAGIESVIDLVAADACYHLGGC